MDTHGAVEFVQASATNLDAAERVKERAHELGGFKVALDSALLHCLDDDAQRDYIKGVRELVRQGGSLCTYHASPTPIPTPVITRGACRKHSFALCLRRATDGISSRSQGSLVPATARCSVIEWRCTDDCLVVSC